MGLSSYEIRRVAATIIPFPVRKPIVGGLLVHQSVYKLQYKDKLQVRGGKWWWGGQGGWWQQLSTFLCVCFFKYKSKVYLVHATKKYVGGGGRSYGSILSYPRLYRGECLISLPGRFTPGSEPWYILNWRLGRRQSWYEYFGEEDNLMPMLGFELRLFQPVT
jgi:hypothetical protein